MPVMGTADRSGSHAPQPNAAAAASGRPASPLQPPPAPAAASREDPLVVPGGVRGGGRPVAVGAPPRPGLSGHFSHPPARAY